MTKRESVIGKGVEAMFSNNVSSSARKQPKTAITQPQKKALPPRPQKKKKGVYFYIPQDIFEQLDDLWFVLRREFRGRKNIDKSDIVTASLDYMIKDYANKTSNSFIFKNLSRNLL